MVSHADDVLVEQLGPTHSTIWCGVHSAAPIFRAIKDPFCLVRLYEERPDYVELPTFSVYIQLFATFASYRLFKYYFLAQIVVLC